MFPGPAELVALVLVFMLIGYSCGKLVEYAFDQVDVTVELKPE